MDVTGGVWKFSANSASRVRSGSFVRSERFLSFAQVILTFVRKRGSRSKAYRHGNFAARSNRDHQAFWLSVPRMGRSRPPPCRTKRDKGRAPSEVETG